MDYYTDYYSILEIESSATQSKIKASFRNKLKQLHPDVQGDIKSSFIMDNLVSPTNNELLQLIQAYTVLSNPIKRKRYDQHVSKVPSYVKRRKKIFDYEKFLYERQNIFFYRARLLLYDLVYKSGDTAILIYEDILLQRKKLLLKSELGRLDYIDCLVLIAEYYQKRMLKGDIDKCIILYREIFSLEQHIHYFKDYMRIMVEDIQNLLENHIAHFSQQGISQKEALEDILTHMLHGGFSKSLVKQAKELQRNLIELTTNK